MKNCLTCGKEISDKNKSGYCKKHLDVSGEKNPFYGKTFSEETLNRIKQKTREASIKKWQDPVYRDKNIKSTSLENSSMLFSLSSKAGIRLRSLFCLNTSNISSLIALTPLIFTYLLNLSI